MAWTALSDPENPENRNAGNGGDLVKHTVYLTILDYLRGQRPWCEELRVRECHAGRGIYPIPHEDGRRPMLECLYDPVDADLGVVLHDQQRASQMALGIWSTAPAGFSWYAGSAVLNAMRLATIPGNHLIELYESATDTRRILREVLADVDARVPGVDIRVVQGSDENRNFDGELHIANSIANWDSQDLVLLDPFAMWRQDHHQAQRDKYGRVIDTMIGQGHESPMLVLFWTWGQAFKAADGDLQGTSSVVPNGYQDLRSRLHRSDRHLIRVSWRWGLQFAMWAIVGESHLNGLAAALQQQCRGIRDHLLRRCKGRLKNPDVEVVVD